MIQTDIPEIALGYTGGTFSPTVYYENSTYGGVTPPSCPDWITFEYIGGAQEDTTYVESYTFTVAENTGATRYGTIALQCQDTSGETWHQTISVYQGTGEKVETSIWRDTFYYAAGVDTFVYSIKKDGVAVYFGKAYCRPGDGGAYVQVNRICQNYLKQVLGDYRGVLSQVIENVGGYGDFSICDKYGAEVMNYRFLYDWFGDWEGEGEYIMTTHIGGTGAINGHLDPRMYLMHTVYNTAETEVSVVIDDSGRSSSNTGDTTGTTTGETTGSTTGNTTGSTTGDTTGNTYSLSVSPSTKNITYGGQSQSFYINVTSSTGSFIAEVKTGQSFLNPWNSGWSSLSGTGTTSISVLVKITNGSYGTYTGTIGVKAMDGSTVIDSTEQIVTVNVSYPAPSTGSTTGTTTGSTTGETYSLQVSPTSLTITTANTYNGVFVGVTSSTGSFSVEQETNTRLSISTTNGGFYVYYSAPDPSEAVLYPYYETITVKVGNVTKTVGVSVLVP